MPETFPPFSYQKLVLNDRTLAWRQDGKASARANILFLSGFFSDMTGTKASFLAQKCEEAGRQLTRFDYRGHGVSSGKFEDYGIGEWLDDSLHILDQVTKGPQIVVGSSMGGWLMLLLALARPERVAALVGIAPAPDFTEDLIWKTLSPERQREMMEKGAVYETSEYQGNPVPYTRHLIEEGRKHLLLDKPIPITCPVRILQGMKDEDVPPHHATRLAEQLRETDVHVTFIEDGDHRLSRPQDLDLLWQTVQSMKI
jgi:pimeloyl-ACP methyl ester carboxylesterase